MKKLPSIALVPVPLELSGLSYKAAIEALQDTPRIHAAAMAGPAGVERLRWAYTWGTSNDHADHLAVVAAAVAAAVQAGRMTPQFACDHLDAAIAAGHHQPVLVSFDDARDQAEESGPLETRPMSAAADVDTLDALVTAATVMAIPPSLPAATLRPCAQVVHSAALVVAGLLPKGVALTGLVDLDHDAQVRVLRRLQRNWPASIPTSALFIAAGSAQRTTTRDDGYGVIIGPLPYLLARDHASGLPKTTYRRWEAWGRALAGQTATASPTAMAA